MKIYNLNRQDKIHTKSFGKIAPNYFFINHSAYAKDMNWAKAVTASVVEVVPQIKAKKINFKEALDFIARRYKEHFSSSNIDFGMPRTDTLHTYLNQDKYVSYAGKARKIFSQGQKNLNGDYPKRHLVGALTGKVNNEASGSIPVKYDYYTKYIKIDEKKTALTETIRIFNLPKEIEMPTNMNGEILAWQHTDCTEIPGVLSRVETLYSKLMDSKQNNLDKIVERIAEIHWLLAQTAPFKRGSAGISDAVTKALFEAKNIQISQWKAGIVPDCEALTSSLREFKLNYAGFFKKHPKLLICSF